MGVFFCVRDIFVAFVFEMNTSKDDHENTSDESSKVHLSEAEHWQPPLQNKRLIKVQTRNVQQIYLAKTTYIHAQICLSSG